MGTLVISEDMYGACVCVRFNEVTIKALYFKEGIALIN